MGLVLTLRIDSLLAGTVIVMLHEAAGTIRGGQRLEPAVLGESEAGHVPARIVGCEDDLAFTINGHMAWPGAARRLRTTRLQGPRRLIDCEGLDRTSRLAIGTRDLRGRVEHREPRVERQERGVLRNAGEHRLRDGAGDGVELRHIDALRRRLRLRVVTEPDRNLVGQGGG